MMGKNTALPSTYYNLYSGPGKLTKVFYQRISLYIKSINFLFYTYLHLARFELVDFKYSGCISGKTVDT